MALTSPELFAAKQEFSTGERWGSLAIWKRNNRWEKVSWKLLRQSTRTSCCGFGMALSREENY
jgi:hypothetical protein